MFSVTGLVVMLLFFLVAAILIIISLVLERNQLAQDLESSNDMRGRESAGHERDMREVYAAAYVLADALPTITIQRHDGLTDGFYTDLSNGGQIIPVLRQIKMYHLDPFLDMDSACMGDSRETLARKGKELLDHVLKKWQK